MGFKLIDRDNWTRDVYFQHYFSNIPCTYSMSVKLDITSLRKSGQKLYPTMLYFLTTIVNRHSEFRTALNDEGQLGIFDSMHPCYTVFHNDSQTFSNLWTEYHENYEQFCSAYEIDRANYASNMTFSAKPNQPENIFTVSMLPWVSFEGFNLNLQKGYAYLLPIFTLGRYYDEGTKTLLPLAIQVHHAVCDGFHVCRFVDELQTLINQFFENTD